MASETNEPKSTNEVTTSETTTNETTNEAQEAPAVTDADACSVEEIEEAIKGFLTGDLTLAQLEGLTAEDLYAMADVGYDLLEEGRVDDARKVFEGLNVYNPFGPYFHSVLGSIYQKLGMPDESLRHYESAVELFPEDIHSWTNAGELMLELSAKYADENEEVSQKLFHEALCALERAVELDPECESAAALRARALIGVVVSAFEARKAS
ncbi:MAG: tetratricopeptide repeat protein [Gemmatimonadetes bacterium]|nr:tetratricopeptide repeat protein [Gemmatimonadota bacterium]